MNRKDFFKKCSVGTCGCVGMLMIAPGKARASENEPVKEDWRIGFMQKRMAKFIKIINSNFNQETRNKLIEEFGRSCASELKMTEDYKGKIEEYLEVVAKKWVDTYEYDKENGIIKIADKKRESCFCPFVDSSLMTKDFCNCSIGWQKHTYETILGTKVDVTVDTSILRGGERCSFTIKKV